MHKLKSLHEPDNKHAHWGLSFTHTNRTVSLSPLHLHMHTPTHTHTHIGRDIFDMTIAAHIIMPFRVVMNEFGSLNF